MSSDWNSFFATTAQVAVTAFSIMFLSMQVRSAVWRRGKLRTVTAAGALVELAVPLLMSLIAVMDGHHWRVAGYLGGGLGLLTVAIHGAIYVKERQTVTPFDRGQMWGTGIVSTAVYVLVVVSAWDPFGWGPQFLAAMCVWLLLSGSFEAWYLLEPKGITTGTSESAGSFTRT